MRKTTLSILMASAALAMVLPATSFAEDTGGYSDDTDWDLTSTATRADDNETGPTVGDIQSPGYNPNYLRPAGDGLGKHQATQDLNMQNNNISGIGNIYGVGDIIGDGSTRILGVATPVDDTEVANKKYVDDELTRFADDFPTGEDMANTISAGDGVDVEVAGESATVSVDNTVVRTSGDQNIAGVKNFQTRINVSSTSNRPFDSRSDALGGIGVYGRSTNPNEGTGVLGMADGANGTGVAGYALGQYGRAGNFSASGEAGVGVYAVNDGPGGRAATFRSEDGSAETVSVVGWEVGDRLMSFGVDDTGASVADVDGAIYSTAGGIMITGITAPVNDDDVTNKGYVDDTIDALGYTGPQDLQDVLTEGNNAGGVRITSLGEPVDNDDAVNKKYVDDIVAGIGVATTPALVDVLTEGNTAGGLRIRSMGAPVNNDDATTKKYVDDAIAGVVTDPQTLSEVLSEGNSAAGGRIISLGAPVNQNDAVNKKYVDDAISGVSVGGGADNLGNHTATQALDLDGNVMNNVRLMRVEQQSNGATLAIGADAGYKDTNYHITGTRGDGTAELTTYIDKAQIGGWRIREHEDGTSGFTDALELDFDTRDLFLYGSRILTVDNLNQQELNFDNDRDGYYDAVTDAYYNTNAITSTISGDIATGFKFAATGNRASGFIGFAAGNNAAGGRAISLEPNTVGFTATVQPPSTSTDWTASANDSVPQKGIYSRVIPGSMPGSIAIAAENMIDDGVVLELNARSSSERLMDFRRNGVHVGYMDWASDNTLTLNMGVDGVRTGRVIGLRNPTEDYEAANKAYVDAAISGGGADNLGNHTATQTLDMADEKIENIESASFLDGAGAGIAFGDNIAYTDVNVRVVGAPGSSGASLTTYMDNTSLDNWRVRTHDGGGSNPENALNLRFTERDLLLFGEKVLTTANLGDQQLDFNNDRDGSLIVSPAGFNLYSYSTAIRSEASGDIAASMIFRATGENSTGIIGFASADGSAAFKGVSSGPSSIGGNFSAQGNDGVPFATPQTSLKTTLRSDVAVGSVSASFSTSAENTTVLEVQSGTSNAKLASFQVGNAEVLSIDPNGTSGRMLGYNGSAGEQTVDLNLYTGNLSLTGNSSGGLHISQPSNTPKVILKRTNSSFGNSHIQYEADDGTTSTSVVAGLGSAGKFAIGTGNDLSYSSTASFEVAAATGDVNWKGTATGVHVTPSDARLKENVADLVNAMALLSQLRPVEYDLIDSGSHNYGVIAQEIQAIYPEMVHVDENGIMAVEYTQLIAPMLSAIIEMDARITALEAQ